MILDLTTSLIGLILCIGGMGVCHYVRQYIKLQIRRCKIESDWEKDEQRRKKYSDRINWYRVHKTPCLSYSWESQNFTEVMRK